MYKIYQKIIVVISFFIAVSATAAYADKDEIYTSYFSSAGAGGYDVVAYFTAGKPIKGNDDISAEYKDTDWYFSSAQNLIKFKENPAMYVPQYGGYCAWAVAKGSTASGDPLMWTVVNNKLYLNYNAAVQTKWTENKDDLIIRGDMNWPKVLE